MSLRDKWRIGLLLALLLASGVALFYPGVGATRGPTNLRYGLDLDGGSRIRAPVVGHTAENVQFDGDPASIEATVAKELNVTVTDVRYVREANALEVVTKVDQTAFENALDSANVTYDTVRPGVTDQTRANLVRALTQKINRAGLSGGQVTTIYSASENRYFVVIEVPNQDIQSLREIVTRRGTVRIVAAYPTDNGSARTTVITQNDFRNVGTPETFSDGPGISATLEPSVASSFASDMKQYGYTSRGVSSCHYDMNASADQDPGYCLLTVRDGKVVYAAGMSQGLADTINSGAFVEDPTFRLMTRSLDEARQLQLDLRAGALPAPLDIDAGSVNYVSPTLGSRFKLLSFLTGLIAVLSVSGVVFVRYREPRVALPMLATALSEVVILLGFSAAIGYPLDLSVIAGFIAVVGTGVDDLVIIADEVMTERVSSSRVFKSRFRRALWVIGAAAATTIVAMLPLTRLSLGDLQGFAIITILGVLIGVLITRPAYGDVLRTLLTDQ